VQLALIYGESSGIDLRGFKVLTRQASKAGAGCADVEITTFKGDDVVRRETVHACRAH
jgi:phosphate starvation-inducible protein PhoH